MIMPTKYLREDEALIGVCALLLPFIDRNKNLSDLWEKAKNVSSVGNYERFVLALDLLFMFGLIEIHNNEIVRVHL
jgi:hypothetical protein